MLWVMRTPPPSSAPQIVHNFKTGKLNGVNVHVLPRGMVQLDVQLPQTFSGVVSRGVASRKDKGVITISAVEDGAGPTPKGCQPGAELSFQQKEVVQGSRTPHDASDASQGPTHLLRTGDRVRFLVRQSKATGAFRAVRVEFVGSPETPKPDPGGPEEAGIVTVVKELLSCCSA